MAVAAGDLSAGLVGAGVGLALVGALATFVVRTDVTMVNVLALPIWAVLYPASAVIGYDLAAGGEDDETLRRLAGYSVAVAGAHAALAVGFVACVLAEVGGTSSVPYVIFAFCPAAGVAAWVPAMSVGHRLHVPAGALVGASVAGVVLVWMAAFLTVITTVNGD